MKRPTSSKPLSGEHIPARKSPAPISNEDDKSKSEGLLSKLGAQDVVALFNSVSSLSNSLVELQKEREKTSQAMINSRVRIEEIDVDRKRVRSERDLRIEELRNERKSSKYRHEESLKNIQIQEVMERERRETINRIISMVESGSITPEMLAILISNLGES